MYIFTLRCSILSSGWHKSVIECSRLKLTQCHYSVCRGTCCQAWLSEFSLQVPHGRRREPKLPPDSSHPLAFMFCQSWVWWLPLYPLCFRGDRQIPKAHGLASLAQSVSSGSVRNLISQNTLGRWLKKIPEVASGHYTHLRVHPFALAQISAYLPRTHFKTKDKSEKVRWLSGQKHWESWWPEFICCCSTTKSIGVVLWPPHSAHLLHICTSAQWC